MTDAAAYGPTIYQEKFRDYVSSYDASTPLFVYYAESLVHEPIEAPDYIFTQYGQLAHVS
jgi:hypothetical protein